jgi:short-subunit dehydrogenase
MILCSIAGHYDLKTLGMHMYSATKHAVTALTEGLRVELVSQGYKIRVTVSKTTTNCFVINALKPFDVTVKMSVFCPHSVIISFVRFLH